MKTKRGIVWSEIAWWVIGLIVLALVVVAIILMRTRGMNIIDQIRQLFKFGR